MKQADPAPVRHIVYVQYTNPAGYPPLEHSSRLLADGGWNVLFLGASAFGAETLSFPPHARISTRRWNRGTSTGIRQKLGFGVYGAWVAATCARIRPDWIYASDPLSCLPALAAVALSGARLLYHEHDAPGPRARGVMANVIARARHAVARRADLCIIPQKRRMEAFLAETGRARETLCVWNCPSRDEVLENPRPPLAPGEPLTFYYHGSLNAERVPFSLVDALAQCGDRAELLLAGYETVGSKGFVRELMRRAEAIGIEKRINYAGPIERRLDLLALAASADVGLAFMPFRSSDINMAEMAGASNKPFDYLAVGQFLLVSDLPDWREMFVSTGYGQACDPFDPSSLAGAMRWCVENPEAIRDGGEAGRRQILAQWNYESCFAPVINTLTARELGVAENY